MKISIGSDHRGLHLKNKLIPLLEELGHETIDVGTHDGKSVDYPDYAAQVAEEVSRGGSDRGILICGTGIGMSIAANKFPGVRAGLCHDHYSAHQGVEHDDMNVLCLGSEVVGPSLARELVAAFLGARFDGGERYVTTPLFQELARKESGAR